MVDDKKIALTPAYQLAALTPKEQALLLETIDSEQATPSLSQAQRMKKLSQSGELNEDTMLQIMAEQKKPERTDNCSRSAAASTLRNDASSRSRKPRNRKNRMWNCKALAVFIVKMSGVFFCSPKGRCDEYI